MRLVFQKFGPQHEIWILLRSASVSRNGFGCGEYLTNNCLRSLCSPCSNMYAQQRRCNCSSVTRVVSEVKEHSDQWQCTERHRTRLWGRVLFRMFHTRWEVGGNWEIVRVRNVCTRVLEFNEMHFCAELCFHRNYDGIQVICNTVLSLNITFSIGDVAIYSTLVA
jgi:hypothetical protein